MGTMATVRVNTTQNMILHRGFIIQEAYSAGQNVWEWTHEDFDRADFPVTGECQTVFECIDAIDDWHNGEGPEQHSKFAARRAALNTRNAV